MATTGFWPVKSRLKEVIDYAENPDKTTDKKFLDEDLYAALRYVEDDKKTEQTMYVSLTVANKILIEAGAGILTITDKYMEEFNTLLIDFYNTDDAKKLKSFLYENAIQGIEM